VIADTTPEPQTLAEIVVSAARRADNTHLFVMMCVGLGGAMLVDFYFGRAGWFGAAAPLAIGAYGAWGLSDRKLNALWSVPGSDDRAIILLRLARGLSGLAAILGAVVTLSAVFVPALGLWRS
jgi:hypothetical protein